MKHMQFIAAWLLFAIPAGGLCAEEKAGVEPAGKRFIDLLKKGQSVILTRENAGFHIIIFQSRQDAQASRKLAERESTNDIEIRYAKKASEVAQVEYQKALEANRRFAETVPKIEVRRLQLAAERAVLQIEEAQFRLTQARRYLSKLQRGADFEIFEVGRDYIGLRRLRNQTFIPLSSIRSISRAVKAETTGTAEGK